jgi:hypothetical protein
MWFFFKQSFSEPCGFSTTGTPIYTILWVDLTYWLKRESHQMVNNGNKCNRKSNRRRLKKTLTSYLMWKSRNSSTIWYMAESDAKLPKIWRWTLQIKIKFVSTRNMNGRTFLNGNSYPKRGRTQENISLLLKAWRLQWSCLPESSWSDDFR